MMKIISWNVNGLRAIAKKGFWDFLQEESPDILCLQETKAHPSQLDESIQEALSGYHQYYASAEKKGYSGVAIFVKKKSFPSESSFSVKEGLGIAKFDSEGRSLIFESADFILFNGYYPNGQDDLGRVPYKLEYSEAVLKQACALRKKHGDKKGIILTGDFNTAHQEIDLARPKENVKSTGFLPIERAFLDKLISAGFSDVFRSLHPEEKEKYTWWSYRNFGRDRNVGWRIDYFFMDEQYLKNNKVEMDHLDQQLGSDHCPIAISVNIR
jgi:exodeoxyribonuclease-3